MENLEKTGSIISWLNDIISLITNHGIFKLILSILILCLCIICIKFSITFDPENYIKTINEIEVQIEDENRTYRKESDVYIREVLRELSDELGTSRTSILEFHNGKVNSSGLGFYYIDMSYEIISEHTWFISEQYQNISLSWLEIDDVLYENGYWYGTTEELKEIDLMIGTKVESNGTKWIGMYLLESTNDDHVTTPLGILTVSFDYIPTLGHQKEIGRAIRKSGMYIISKLSF